MEQWKVQRAYTQVAVAKENAVAAKRRYNANPTPEGQYEFMKKFDEWQERIAQYYEVVSK